MNEARFFVRLFLFFILFVAIDNTVSWLPAIKATEWFVSMTSPFASHGADGFLVNMPDGPLLVTIDWDCTGWKSMYFYTALVLSTAVEWEKKLRAFLFVPILYLFNIARISGSMWIASKFGYHAFNVAHDMLFGYVSVLLALWAWGIFVVVSRHGH